MSISNQKELVKNGFKSAKKAGGELKVKVDGEQTTLPAFRVDDSGLHIMVFCGTGTEEQFRDGVSFLVLQDYLGKEVGPADASLMYWKEGSSWLWLDGKLKVTRDNAGNLYFGSMSATFADDAPAKELTEGIFSVAIVK